LDQIASDDGDGADKGDDNGDDSDAEGSDAEDEVQDDGDQADSSDEDDDDSDSDVSNSSEEESEGEFDPRSLPSVPPPLAPKHMFNMDRMIKHACITMEIVMPFELEALSIVTTSPSESDGGDEEALNRRKKGARKSFAGDGVEFDGEDSFRSATSSRSGSQLSSQRSDELATSPLIIKVHSDDDDNDGNPRYQKSSSKKHRKLIQDGQDSTQGELRLDLSDSLHGDDAHAVVQVDDGDDDADVDDDDGADEAGAKRRQRSEKRRHKHGIDLEHIIPRVDSERGPMGLVSPTSVKSDDSSATFATTATGADQATPSHAPIYRSHTWQWLQEYFGGLGDEGKQMVRQLTEVHHLLKDQRSFAWLALGLGLLGILFQVAQREVDYKYGKQVCRFIPVPAMGE
jgi:hypothetical protein